jgi:sugar-specific transcriptional regulator TrmB
MRSPSLLSASPPRHPAPVRVQLSPIAPPERAAPVVEPSLDLAAGLRLVGMPSRQARLYLALSRGPQTARHASEVARLHRATAYRLLVRLLERGLIVGGGWSPQKFQAVPPEQLLARLEGYLREEADLCGALTQAYARWARRPSEGIRLEAEAPVPMVLPPRSDSNDIILAELEGTRQTLDLVLRPVDCSIPFRTNLLRTIGNLVRRGVRIRLLTDATPPDQRFAAALARDSGEARRLLTRRQLAPVGVHYYVCDGRVAIRLPAIGFSGHLPGIALVERDPARVRTQVDRFEALWAQASDPFGPARSTRAYAWNQAAKRFQSERDGTTRTAPLTVVESGPALTLRIQNS